MWTIWMSPLDKRPCRLWLVCLLEGVFALGQVYVLISRVTDPVNMQLVGLPPMDLLPDIYAAWQAAEGLVWPRH